MSNKIYLRRGTDAERGTVVLDSGEPGWTTDTKELYVGDGVTYGGILVTGGGGGGGGGTLCALSDVSCGGTADGYVLAYEASSGTWKPTAAAGGGDMLISQYVTGAGTVYNATRLAGDVLATVQAHNVDAGIITEGTIGLARVPAIDDDRIPNLETLSYGGTFAAGQIPNLPTSKITTGTFNANRIPALPTTRITTGTFNLNRIPALANLKGTVTDAKIPDLETLSYGAAFAAAQIPNLDGSKVTTGTFNADRIPILPTSRITTGTFGIARIPSITNAYLAGDITSDKISALSGTAITYPLNADTVGTTAIKASGVGNAELAASGLDISKCTIGTAGLARIPVLSTDRYGSAVLLTGAQNIGGTKTFSDIPILPASDPTAENEAARKAYVDAGGGGGIKFHPYVGDETQFETVSSTYQDIKNFHFVKHGSVVSPGTIRIACELKTTAGSYQMQIIVGGGTALTLSGTELAYKLRYGDYGLGGVATGVVEVRAKIRNIGAGTSFNRLYDTYLKY